LDLNKLQVLISSLSSSAHPLTLSLSSVSSAEKEDFALAERRQQAITFLDNPELLEMHALSTGLVSSRTVRIAISIE
jgi:hypothetical protein